jgi:hypothetical protein
VVEAGTRWRSLVALLIVPVAVAGYALGHKGHTVAAAPPRTHPVYAAGAVLESPLDWTTSAQTPAIPGLSLQAPVTLAPKGDGGAGGVVVGQLPRGGPTPMPATLLAQVTPAPRGEVVSLAETQAYRYAGLRVAGFADVLELYAVPRADGGTIGVACYASNAGSGTMRTCEQIVAVLKLVGQPRGPNLTVEPVYAGKVAALLGGLDQQRQNLRTQISRQTSRTVVAHLTQTLSQSFTSAANVLSKLEAPLPAGHAHALLFHALRRTASAYAELAAAASANSLSAYEAARANVNSAESEISATLEDYSLIGYGRA